MVSGEAVFSLNSEVNKGKCQKICIAWWWTSARSLSWANQIMVWLVWQGQAAIVLGPYFVQGNLNSRECLRIIHYNVIQRDFRLHGIDKNTVWWQQDGASSHTSNATIRYLRGHFPGRVINKHGDWPWSPRFPDLTLCDFFLWIYLKHKIWNVPLDQQPNNLRQLREAIVMERRYGLASKTLYQRRWAGFRRWINVSQHRLFYTFLCFMIRIVIFIHTLYTICMSFLNILKLYDEF